MSEHEHDTAQQQADNERVAAENQSLRNTLDQERRDLDAQLAGVRQQASGGLTDDDVRRAEHPEEFTDADPDGDADDDPATIAPVAPAATTGPTDTTAGFAQTAAGTLAAVEPASTLDDPQAPASGPAAAAEGAPREPSLLERMLRGNTPTSGGQ